MCIMKNCIPTLPGAIKTENGTFYRYLYGQLTDSRSDLGTAMDGYGYDDTEMERGGQGKV